MNQYAKRKLEFTFNMGEGAFGEKRGSDVVLSGHRASVGLALYGAASKPTAQFRIFGLPLEMINQLTRVGWRPGAFKENRVMIAAGDEGGAMSVVHMGSIETAFANFNAAPDVALEVMSMSGLVEAMRPVAARSYVGPTDAGDIMADLAKDMGVAFERNGVSVILQNPYLPGTAWAQVERCANAARINYSLDRGILSIWNRNGARQASKAIRIAPDTGMVGYPTFNGNGISVRNLFNPDVVLGSEVEVDTEITVAKGKWVAHSVYHTLESETPNGQWFTDVLCHRGLIQ
ncbi:baseplate hub protein [Pandoraea apista]|uniref:baseplate hub protein n=1 Tax=Pandoraea apista TaxID=93218 RepID=UPI002F939233